MLTELDAVLSPLCDAYEIIAIDDQSDDETWTEIKATAATNPRIVPILNPANLGVGGSFQHAVKESRYDWVGYTDGDDQYELNDLAEFVPHLGTHQVVSGHRVNRADGWKRNLISSHFNGIMNAVFGIPLHDINSALKIYRGSLLRDLPPWNPQAFYDAEILIRLHVEQQIKIKEIPIRHRSRSHGVAAGVSKRNIVSILEGATTPELAHCWAQGWRSSAARLYSRFLLQVTRILL
ncbi:MAG: hypothetical protein SynsKO_34520 [Synoicihabitans sp.]